MPTPEPTPTSAMQQPEVTIWAPYAGQIEIDTLAANAGLIREINFFWYELGGDGQIVGGVKSKAALDKARELGLCPVVDPSVFNGPDETTII